MLDGLINTHGHNVPWDKIAETYDRDDWWMPEDLTAGRNVAWPLPLLKAMEREKDPVPDAERVSSLVQAHLRELLKERHSYYVPPDSLLFIADGIAFHTWLERYGGVEAERRLTLLLTLSNGQKAKVTGKPDLAGAELMDYKRMNAYGLKKTMDNGLDVEHPEYVNQVKFYGVLLKLAERAVKPPYRIFIWASNKRHGRNLHDPTFAEFLVFPTEFDGQALNSAVEERIMYRKMKDADIPACDDKDKYGQTRHGPKRCVKYCEMRRFCPWFQKTHGEASE